MNIYFPWLSVERIVDMKQLIHTKHMVRRPRRRKKCMWKKKKSTNTDTSAQENMLMLIWNRGKERSFYCPVGSLCFIHIRVVFRYSLGFCFSFEFLSHSSITATAHKLSGNRVGRQLSSLEECNCSFRCGVLVSVPTFNIS